MQASLDWARWAAPMARNLLAKGHELVVYDVVPQAVAALTAAGARRGGDAARSRGGRGLRHHDAPGFAGRRARGARSRRHRRGHPAGSGVHRHEHDRPGDHAPRRREDPRERRGDDRQSRRQDRRCRRGGHVDADGGRSGGGDRALPSAARRHGHGLLPLRPARCRANDEAPEQPARSGAGRCVDRGARGWRQGGPHARHDDERAAHDDGVEQSARDRNAQAAARRRLLRPAS